MHHKVTNSSLLPVSSYIREALDSYVVEISRKIDEQILSAHNLGSGYVSVELPTVFCIKNATAGDCQLYVYSELVRMYTTNEPNGRGFTDVRLTSNRDKTSIDIRWTSWLGKNDRESRTSLLYKHTNK